jgi:predicted anti-sigma-YlaC factor YlaD
MVVNCEQVWLEVSNYLDGEVEPGLRVAIEEHVRGCRHCTAVVDGMRNVVQLYGDERMLEVPLGFSHRLQQRLSNQSREENMQGTRRTFLGWMVAAAAAVFVFGGLEAIRSASRAPQLRSAMAQPGRGVPPDMMVVVAEDGKLFHVKGCDFIRNKTDLRTLTAAEATREGYTPCVRCLKKYVETASSG